MHVPDACTCTAFVTYASAEAAAAALAAGPRFQVNGAPVKAERCKLRKDGRDGAEWKFGNPEWAAAETAARPHPPPGLAAAGAVALGPGAEEAAALAFRKQVAELLTTDGPQTVSRLRELHRHRCVGRRALHLFSFLNPSRRQAPAS